MASDGGGELTWADLALIPFALAMLALHLVTGCPDGQYAMDKERGFAYCSGCRRILGWRHSRDEEER